MKQLGLFEWQKRYDRINKGGNPLVKLNKVVDWEAFRELLMKVREKDRRSNAGAMSLSMLNVPRMSK